MKGYLVKLEMLFNSLIGGKNNFIKFLLKWNSNQLKNSNNKVKLRLILLTISKIFKFKEVAPNKIGIMLTILLDAWKKWLKIFHFTTINQNNLQIVHLKKLLTNWTSLGMSSKISNLSINLEWANFKDKINSMKFLLRWNLYKCKTTKNIDQLRFNVMKKVRLLYLKYLLGWRHIYHNVL